MQADLYCSQKVWGVMRSVEFRFTKFTIVRTPPNTTLPGPAGAGSGVVVGTDGGAGSGRGGVGPMGGPDPAAGPTAGGAASCGAVAGEPGAGVTTGGGMSSDVVKPGPTPVCFRSSCKAPRTLATSIANCL